jgi:hypothetical protein
MNQTAEALCKLYAIADHRLLGTGGWPACEEETAAFFRITEDWELAEDGPITALGFEVSIDLMTVFAGCEMLAHIPEILEHYGYINSSEADELWKLPFTEFEARLHSFVFRAYRDFCGHSKWLN